jgi:clostripain
MLAALFLLAPRMPAPGAEPTPWTFLIYAACDNSAEADGNFFTFLDRVRRALEDDAAVEVVLFIDRSTKYSRNATSLGEDFTDARLYKVRHSECQRLAGGEQFPELTLASNHEVDSADPTNLRKFLAFGKARFPARHTALMLYGHADGRAMCPDEQSGREMGFAQLTDAVGAEGAVDLMALELCNMGGIEIAYQWRPGNGAFHTDVLMAIPNAGPAMDWSRVFARLGRRAGRVDPATLSPQDFGRLIVEQGAAGRRAAGEEHEAIACYDLIQAAEVKEAVDALAVELARTGAKAVFAELRGPGPDGFALNYARDRLEQAPYVDLADLCRRLEGCPRVEASVRDASRAALESTDALVLASWGGRELPRFEPGTNGIYVVCPSERTWPRCRWYTPLEVKRVYGRLAWCQDGAQAGNGQVENWFELLDSWYDDPSDAGGGANHCAP